MKSSYRRLHENVPTVVKMQVKKDTSGICVSWQEYTVSQRGDLLQAFLYIELHSSTPMAKNFNISTCLAKSQKFVLCTYWRRAETAVHQVWWREDESANSKC